MPISSAWLVDHSEGPGGAAQTTQYSREASYRGKPGLKNMKVRHPAELRLKSMTGYDVGPEQAAQTTSSIALPFEPECPNGVPPRRHHIIGYLRALTLASDDCRCGAPYEIDLRVRDGVGDNFAAESILLLDENAVTVR